MIGIDLSRDRAEYTSPTGDVRAKYFDGVGLGGDFISYLWNGAFATNAKSDCTMVYNFIVQNFAWNEQVHTEVWLFGISRGAYIVRSVAGLINNCGIIQDATNRVLINQAYDLYQSPYDVHKPSSPEMVQFRKDVSYQVRTPIKFMGIFDTIGARGSPDLNYHTGTGFEWPKFHDDRVSSTVEKVYHAMAIHDRFWIFQPFIASRAPAHSNDPDLKIYQKWFPGCHYDLARQEFQFFREGGSALERSIFPILNRTSKTILPNEKIADLVLIWMLQGIDTEGGGDIIQQDMTGYPHTITAVIAHMQESITQASNGTGDMYDHILNYLPGGGLLSMVPAGLTHPHNTAHGILFNPVDRVIPDPGMSNSSTAPVWNQVYPYTVEDASIGGVDMETLAGIDLTRYPSRTYQKYLEYMRAVRRPPYG